METEIAFLHPEFHGTCGEREGRFLANSLGEIYVEKNTPAWSPEKIFPEWQEGDLGN